MGRGWCCLSHSTAVMQDWLAPRLVGLFCTSSPMLKRVGILNIDPESARLPGIGTQEVHDLNCYALPLWQPSGSSPILPSTLPLGSMALTARCKVLIPNRELEEVLGASRADALWTKRRERPGEKEGGRGGNMSKFGNNLITSVAFLPKTHNPYPIRKTSEKPQLRDILQSPT